MFVICNMFVLLSSTTHKFSGAMLLELLRSSLLLGLFFLVSVYNLYLLDFVCRSPKCRTSRQEHPPSKVSELGPLGLQHWASCQILCCRGVCRPREVWCVTWLWKSCSWIAIYESTSIAALLVWLCMIILVLNRFEFWDVFLPALGCKPKECFSNFRWFEVLVGSLHAALLLRTLRFLHGRHRHRAGSAHALAHWSPANHTGVKLALKDVLTRQRPWKTWEKSWRTSHSRCCIVSFLAGCVSRNLCIFCWWTLCSQSWFWRMKRP